MQVVNLIMILNTFIVIYYFIWNSGNVIFLLCFLVAWLCGCELSRVCWISFNCKAIYSWRIWKQDWFAPGQLNSWGISGYSNWNLQKALKDWILSQEKLYLFYKISFSHGFFQRLKSVCSSHLEIHFLKCKCWNIHVTLSYIDYAFYNLNQCHNAIQGLLKWDGLKVTINTIPYILN